MQRDDVGGGSPCAVGMALPALVLLALSGVLNGCGPPSQSRLRAEHHRLRATLPPSTATFQPATATPPPGEQSARDGGAPDQSDEKVASAREPDDADASRAEAVRLAEAGLWREAVTTARRAAAQDPERPERHRPAARVDEIGRRRHVEQVLAETRLALVDGRLVAAESRIASLAALGVGRDDLAELREDLDRRRAAVKETLRSARDLRSRGELGAAVRWYDAAVEAMTDDPAITAERESCSAERDLARAEAEARQAFEAGRFEEATALYTTLLARRGDPGTEVALRRSTAAALRVAVHEAIAKDGTMDVLQTLDRLLVLEPDEELASLRDRVRRHLVRTTLERAGDLDAAGRPDAAVDLLARTLLRVPDLHMQERLRELTPRAVLARATAADRDGRFTRARDLYLQALTVLPGRAGIVERVSDVRVLAALQERAERAEAEAGTCSDELSDLAALLTARDQDLRNARNELRCRETELEDLADEYARLAAHVERTRYDARHADLALVALRDEKDRLCRAIDRAQRDAERWRRRYERERARRDD